ncbi:MAG: histidinol dehydrogenase, partial [Planctomycetota bacterium]
MVTICEGQEAREAIDQIVSRSKIVADEVREGVAETIEAVRVGGDRAVRELAERFGDPTPDRFEVDAASRRAAADKVPRISREVLERAASNIRAFADAVAASLRPVRLEREGFTVGLDYRPVDRVGCYVPGGRFPLPSTALMTACTARAAGVREVCMVSPSIVPEVAFAAKLAEVDRLFTVGGAQAVAALAYGTASIPRVDLIVGPGSAYVTEAKRQLQGVVGIDLLAGPSEVAILADGKADPRWVALDLMAQWEHDPDARAWLLTDNRTLAEAVASVLEEDPEP